MAKRFAVVGVLLAGAILFGGCGKPLTKLTVLATADLNSTAEDPNPASVVVKFYYLKDSQRFLDAEFETIYLADSAAFGADLVSPPVERQLFPDSSFVIPFEPRKGSPVKFIGIVGMFREHGEGGCWKRIIDVKALAGNTVVRVTKSCVELGGAEPREPNAKPASESKSGGDSPKKNEY